MWQLRKIGGCRPQHKHLSGGAALTALVLTTGIAVGAEISGEVIGLDGSPLYRAPVCLKLNTETQDCLKLRFSDRKGKYSFKGLKEGGSYTVSIYLDKSASARKFETYKTYVWAPRSQSAELAHKNDAVALAPFVGKFNYSNYQRAIELTAVDSPNSGRSISR